MPEDRHGVDVGVLDNRVKMLEKDRDKIVVAIESIDDSLKILTRLDVKHDETSRGLSRAFHSIEINTSAIEAAKERVRLIETQLPGLNMIRGWVIAAVVGIVALVGMEAFNLIVNQSELHQTTRIDHTINMPGARP